MGQYFIHSWDRDELDRRTKESIALIRRGGLVCLLLTQAFRDSDGHNDFSDTDLSKRLLSGFGIRREEFGTRLPYVESKVNELVAFFAEHGAAWSALDIDPSLGKALASAGGRSVSLAAEGSLFVIPTLLPKSMVEAVEGYFSSLADGVVSLWQRLKEDLPEWVAEFRIADEARLLADKSELLEKVAGIESQLQTFERMKRILVLQSEPLVDAVAEVLEAVLPLSVSRQEAFREDLRLLDPQGRVVALVEVKGVSRSVSRENVNQADSHRERVGMPPEFPSFLIVNTNLKADSIAQKDQRIASEQVQHAARNNVLIIRTLDLLNLASLSISGNLDPEGVVALLTTSSGRLRVGDSMEILKE
jgi:hypothetical protein